MSQFEIRFEVLIDMPKDKSWESNERTEYSTLRNVTLKAICGPGDNGEPVITILMLDED